MVEFYDPTDVFGDLAEALAELVPGRRQDEADEEEDDATTSRRRDDDDEDDDDERRVRRGRTTSTDMAMKLLERGAARDTRVPARAVAADAIHAPWLAAARQAGQFVHVRTPDYSGLVLRRPFSINTFDRQAARSRSTSGSPASARNGWRACKPGDKAEMLGPLGRPFEVDPKTRHMLLVAGGLGMAGVRSLADEALSPKAAT